jgi:hypothetical protein
LTTLSVVGSFNDPTVIVAFASARPVDRAPVDEPQAASSIVTTAVAVSAPSGRSCRRVINRPADDRW